MWYITARKILRNVHRNIASIFFQKTSGTILVLQFLKSQRRFCIFSFSKLKDDFVFLVHTLYIDIFFNKIINILYLYFIKTSGTILQDNFIENSGTILSLKFFKTQRRFYPCNFSKNPEMILYFQSYKKRLLELNGTEWN